MALDMAGEVRGPVATTASSPGTWVTSWPVTTRIPGWASTRRVTAAEKSSRSTARAPPAETAVSLAASRVREPNSAISSFRSPAAEMGRVDLKELEQTNSARPGLLWAGEYFSGFIS